MIRRFVPGLVLLALLGCASKPSDAFLRQFQASQEAPRLPTLTIHLNHSLESVGPNGAEKITGAVEALANGMGFRVEASKVPRRGWTAERTKFDFTGFQAPNLEGITFTQQGNDVQIKPSHTEQVILEWAKAPSEGFAAIMAGQAQGASKQDMELGLTLLGAKDSKAMLDKLAKADEEGRKAKAKTFAENVARAVKDNGYSKAWLISFRKREGTSLPADSPFWKLMANLPSGSAPPVVEPDPTFRACLSFFARKGQPDTKASLRTFAMIAFQDQDGKCAKTEPWTAFSGE